MKKHYSMLGCLAIFVLLLASGTQAFADDTSQFNSFIQDIHVHRARIELKLGLDPQAIRIPHATSYYDDMVDHYEKDQIMSDQISQGIR